MPTLSRTHCSLSEQPGSHWATMLNTVSWKCRDKQHSAKHFLYRFTPSKVRDHSHGTFHDPSHWYLFKLKKESVPCFFGFQMPPMTFISCPPIAFIFPQNVLHRYSSSQEKGPAVTSQKTHLTESVSTEPLTSSEIASA